ncbi:DUF3857 domain-containing protein [Salinimicrobium xinjiangense]|uniref:DUF3857 domain-containing protein n=1 Tax=Salinimicrobium xinjiangense TaxID=438596 RepID=UPI0003F9AFB7|nr:DUF3857 domain-containing protein [Salinimicrobium xinjiangense]
MKLKKYKAVLFLVAGLSGIQATAQLAPEVELYRQKHVNAHVVRLNQETRLDISLNSGNLQIAQHHLEEDLYLSDAAVNNSRRSLNFSSFFEMGDIKASSFLFEKNKFREYKVEDYRQKDELDNSFHDDTKSVNFIFPGLQKGAKSKLEYSETIKNPRFLMPFYFGDFFPVENNTFTVTVDKNVSLRFMQFNTQALKLEFSEEEKRGKKIYTWKATNVEEYENEAGSPTYKRVIPHVVPVISSYTHNGNTINVLNDVNDLYSWYNSLVKDLNKQEDDRELVNLVAEITAGKETELEKVRAIYYWTQKNIKYIAFEYALGGFIPREANEVFQKKYGDCKDNSSILHKMLSLAGIEGKLTWIGTREIPYTYSELPTPLVDNHMILAYRNAGKTYYLDATGRYIPLEYPTSFIQGKEALISNGDAGFEVEIVPVMPAENSAVIENTRLKIEGSDIKGSSKAQVTGYNKIRLFNELEGISNPAKVEEYYNAVFEKGSNRFLISSLEEQNKYEYDLDFILNYDFEVKGYAKEIGDEIYLNLNLNRDLSHYRTLKDRVNEIEYDYKNSFSYTTELEIPEGYEVAYLPANEEFDNDLIKAAISYSRKENKVIYSHDIQFDFLILDLEQQRLVNDLISKAEKAYKEVIILKKIKTS